VRFSPKLGMRAQRYLCGPTLFKSLQKALLVTASEVHHAGEDRRQAEPGCLPGLNALVDYELRSKNSVKPSSGERLTGRFGEQAPNLHRDHSLDAVYRSVLRAAFGAALRLQNPASQHGGFGRWDDCRAAECLLVLIRGICLRIGWYSPVSTLARRGWIGGEFLCSCVYNAPSLYGTRFLPEYPAPLKFTPLCVPSVAKPL